MINIQVRLRGYIYTYYQLQSTVFGGTYVCVCAGNQSRSTFYISDYPKKGVVWIGFTVYLWWWCICVNSNPQHKWCSKLYVTANCHAHTHMAQHMFHHQLYIWLWCQRKHCQGISQPHWSQWWRGRCLHYTNPHLLHFLQASGWKVREFTLTAI